MFGWLAKTIVAQHQRKQYLVAATDIVFDFQTCLMPFQLVYIRLKSVEYAISRFYVANEAPCVLPLCKMHLSEH